MLHLVRNNVISIMKRIMLFALIFIGILLFFIGAHVAVYFSLVKFFAVKSLFIKSFMLWSLVFLGASFFASIFLARASDNAFSRGYYFFANIWIGFMINLLLFFALVWLIVFVSSVFHNVSNEKLWAILAIVASFAYSVYGVWNAFTPRVTSINVVIDSLPKEWAGKKIVQISDVHLGNIYREKHLTDVVGKINALNPDVVVITGDLFDGADEKLDNFLTPLDEIKVPIYFVSGNHETYIGLEKVYGAIAKTKIIPLRDSLKNVEGLQFIGIDYPLRGAGRDIAEIIPKMDGYDQFAPSILLMHEPRQIESAKKIGISLMLSGHTHKGQLFPFGFITSLVFDGYDSGFKREGSFAIYTTSGVGGWGPPMRTESHSEIVEITLQ